MLHHCDLSPLLQPFQGIYEATLNSEDLYFPDLALDKVKAHGGTMVMWHVSLSPYITALPSSSSCYQSILLKMPGSVSSIHTALYLPTAGKEEQYMSALVELEAHLNEINEKFPDMVHFVRGDANSNPKNIGRFNLFSHFCSLFSLRRVELFHTTYHHFVGNRLFGTVVWKQVGNRFL